MELQNARIKRPVALVILDGWGYAPRTEGNAIAIAHTPYYDEICRNYPMTTLTASGAAVGEVDERPGSAEIGHLNIGTGRVAQTEPSKIRAAISNGDFQNNAVLNRAMTKAKENGSSIHLIGLISDAGVHSSTENLFEIIRLAKRYELSDVNIHCILDGVDVPMRTADVYVEALEIKLGDIGLGKIATMCGRFFAMDRSEKWERTARYFTMLVHAEGERTREPITAVRNSFLRGISDEFIAPIVVESAPDVPVTRIKDGDLVIFFNHRADTIRQIVRSLCIPDGAAGVKPMIDTVCLTEYDRAFNLPAAFRPDPERNTLTGILSSLEIPTYKITEAARTSHLTQYFDGEPDGQQPFERHLFIDAKDDNGVYIQPESQSFKIADQLCRGIEQSPHGVFVVNMPAAGLMAESGDLNRTVAAIQYVDTCIGGICEKVREFGGVVMLTSSYGNCEEMVVDESGEPNGLATVNPVPFHYIDDMTSDVMLDDSRSLEDIAPTILSVLNIDKPDEMTGRDIRCS